MARNVGMWCTFLVLCVVVTGAIVTAALSGGGPSGKGSGRYLEATTTPLTSLASWNILTVPCPWNETWCVTDDPPLHKYRILVDLGHAERVKVDGMTSSNLDKSSNSRIFDWQDWVKDMRAQGYEVSVITKRPIAAADLVNADLFIVAQPDKGKNGPVYFTKDEKEAIACFVLRGNTLLVMAQQFMGGKDRTTYTGDMKTTYASADVINDLLEGIHVEGRFTEGKVSGSVLDLMDSDNAATQVFTGTPPDIWLPAGNLKPEMKSNTFAYFHGLSIVPETVDWLVRGDSTTFTSPKNTKYSPVIQPEGSLPVAIGVNGLGCGRVYLYGDPSAWQKDSYIGKVYSEQKYHEQEAARVLVSRMLSFNRTCEPCESQAVQQPATTRTVTTRVTPYRPFDTPTTTKTIMTRTPTRTRTPTVTPTVTPFGDCSSCLIDCNQGTDEASIVGRMECYLGCTGTFEGSMKCRYCLDRARASGETTPEGVTNYYSQCLIDNACRCPEEDCNACLARCGADTACQLSCIDENNRPCITTFTDDCTSCVRNCGTNVDCALDCTEGGQPCIPPFQLDCKTCIDQCEGNAGCVMDCVDENNQPCINRGTISCPNGYQSCYQNVNGGYDCYASGAGPLHACAFGQTMLCTSDNNDPCRTYCSCVDSGPLSYDIDACPVTSIQTMYKDEFEQWVRLPLGSGMECPNGVTPECKLDTDTCIEYCECPPASASWTPTPTPTGAYAWTPTPTPTGAQSWTATSECQACYLSCNQKTASSAGSKDTEAVFPTNACRNACDKKYGTTVLSCACANSPPCGNGYFQTVFTNNMTCGCLPSQTTGGDSFDWTSLSSQWTGHYQGSPTVAPQGPRCHEHCYVYDPSGACQQSGIVCD